VSKETVGRRTDAYLAAHSNLLETDTFAIPVIGMPVPVVNKNSYQWTQKAVVLLGDELIPVWKGDIQKSPKITVSRSTVCEGSRLSFSFDTSVSGTLRFVAGEQLYLVEVNGTGADVDIRGAVTAVSAAFVLPGHFYSFNESLF
jgi:hypothetical protein